MSFNQTSPDAQCAQRNLPVKRGRGCRSKHKGGIMIPYAGNSPHSPHNSKEGQVFFFRLIGGFMLAGFLGSGIFDSDWTMYGPLVLGGLFVGFAELVKRT